MVAEEETEEASTWFRTRTSTPLPFFGFIPSTKLEEELMEKEETVRAKEEKTLNSGFQSGPLSEKRIKKTYCLILYLLA